MGNVLPTVTIVLAEITAVLLILVGFLLFRIRRLHRLHQTEIDTLVAIADDARRLPIDPPPATPAPTPARAAASQDEAHPPQPASIGQPADDHGHRPHDGTDEGLSGHIDELLSGIHKTIEHLDGRLDQFRHEHTLLAAQFRKLVEEGNNEIHYSRRDLDRIYQVVNEFRKQLGDLPGAWRPIDSPPAARPQHPAPEHTVDQNASPRIDIDDLTQLSGSRIDVEEINISDLDLEDPHGLRDGRGHLSQFDEARVFYQSSLEDGLEQGWYFNGYGDKPHGPFADRASANRVMKEMHEQLIQSSRTPTRKGAGKS